MVATCIPLAATALAGCKTTQQSNDRLELRAHRTLASRVPVDVAKQNPDIRVERTAIVDGDKGGAIVAVLKNVSDHVTSDLPIEVGVGGQPLNSGKAFSYGQTRAPALDPGEETTWVFQTDKPLPGGAPFARVGTPPSPALATADSLPDIEASPASAPANSTLSVKITNKSDIPQYDLAVYAAAKKGQRYVVAGTGAVEHLGSNGSTTVNVPLTGDAKASLRLFVSPIYFK
ncbi:MAG: hypothetical protein QOE56_2207 [Solirubrobacterales bacterium]|nr:hypothetical protein [Solirubrobacterales bacterium]